MRLSVLLLLTLLPVAADPLPQDAIKKEREKLQGTWFGAMAPRMGSAGALTFLVYTAKSPEKPQDEGEELSDRVQSVLFWVVLPASAVLLVFAGGLVWWLRRGDRAVQSRLADARKRAFTLTTTEETPEQPPQPPAAGPPT